MDNKRPILAGIIIAVISFSVGKFSTPAKVETKEVEHIVYKDRVVVDEKKDVVTRTKETEMPDGTKVKETVTEDKSASHSDASQALDRDLEITSKTENRPDWRIGATYSREGVYGAVIERRLLSEIYVGVIGSSDSRVGVIVSVGF